jgi:signal recognition particle subunit SRP54
MFETLTQKLGAVFDKLKRRGRAHRGRRRALPCAKVRVALLEADVALSVVKDFVVAVRMKAVGQDVDPLGHAGQMVVKIVHDHLVETLGGRPPRRDQPARHPPVPILMVGLQGSGKTTTTAKIAHAPRSRDKRRC